MESIPHASLDELLAHAGWLRALASALIADPADADDLVQDTWLAAARHPPHADRPPRPWLARVITNLARNKKRDAALRAHREHEVSRPESASDAGDVDREIEMQRALVDALGELDEAQRATIVRHFFHGMSYAEMARAERVAESTVRNRAMRALDVLRAKLDGKYRDRSAWIALLAPIARRVRPGVALPAGPNTATLVGALAMSTVAKISVVLAVAVVSIWCWTLATRQSPTASTVVLQHTSEVALATPSVEATSATIASETREPISAAVAAPSAVAPSAQAIEEPPGVIRARIVASDGAPIVGATLTVVDRLSEISREDAPRATGGANGHVQLDVRRSDRQKNRGMSVAMAKDEWTLEIECSAPAHESKTSTVHIKAGHVAELGDVSLRPGGEVRGRVKIPPDASLPRLSIEVLPPDFTLEERRNAAFHGAWPKRSITWAGVARDGSYAVIGVPVGNYRLTASTGVEGWLHPLSEVVGVRAGETTEVAELELKRNPFVISGIVREPDGTPLHGVEVEYRIPRSTGSGKTHWVGTSSDKHGRFTIALDHESLVDLYFVALREKWGELVLHDVATGRADLDVRLPPVVWMDVRVEDPAHAAIERYTTSIRHVGEEDFAGSDSRPHADGKSRIILRGDPFELVVSAPGRRASTLGPYDRDHHPDALTITLGEASPVPTVRVTADGQPVAHARIELRPAVDSTKSMSCNGFPVHALYPVNSWSDATDDDGRWSPMDVDDGRYFVVAHAPGFARAESRSFEIGAGASSGELTIPLTHGGSVQGRVVAAADGSAAGVLVGISNGDGYVFIARSDASGAFHFDSLAPGRWFARRCEREFDPGSMSNCYEAAGFDPSLAAFDVVDGRTTKFELDLRNAACTLLGALEIGKAARQAWSVDLIADGADAYASLPATTDATGRFRIEPMVLGGHRMFLASARAHDRDQRIDCGVEIRRGVNEWSLSIEAGTLEGEGPPNATLVHTWKNESSVRCTTHFVADAQGHFHAEGIPAGPGTIAVQQPRWSDQREIIVDVKAGEVTRIELP